MIHTWVLSGFKKNQNQNPLQIVRHKDWIENGVEKAARHQLQKTLRKAEEQHHFKTDKEVLLHWNKI